ncbi:alpha/beta fold hydrolase, partial [Acinetobacter baumannii]
RMSTAERRHTDIGRHRLSWLQAGATDAPVALMLHGIPASAELWREVMPAIADAGYCCLAPDLPGYGETVMGPDADYSLGASADLL